MAVHSTTQFRSDALAVAINKGSAPSVGTELLPLPAVTTRKFKGDVDMAALKGDLWIFPGVNLFASVGKVTGTNRIDVAIDLDAVIPRPFCRPAKPCETMNLPFDVKVDNTTLTMRTLLGREPINGAGQAALISAMIWSNRSKY